MIFDATFWVSVAFCFFVALTLKPGFRALLGALDRYRAAIRSQLDNAQTCLQEAHVTLKKAVEADLRIAQQIEDIQAHTEMQIRLHQEETDRKLEQLRSKATESLEKRIILLENAFRQTVHKRLLSETIAHVRNTLSSSPLGQSSSFDSDLSSRP